MKKIVLLICLISSNVFAQSAAELLAIRNEKKTLKEQGAYILDNIESKTIDVKNKTYLVGATIYSNSNFGSSNNVQSKICSFKSSLVIDNGYTTFDCGTHMASAYISSRGNATILIVNQFNDHGESINQETAKLNIVVPNDESAIIKRTWTYQNPKYNGTWDN